MHSLFLLLALKGFFVLDFVDKGFAPVTIISQGDIYIKITYILIYKNSTGY